MNVGLSSAVPVVIVEDLTPTVKQTYKKGGLLAPKILSH